MECGGRFRNLCLDRERSWKWPMTLWPWWGSPLKMQGSMSALPPTSRAGQFHSFHTCIIIRCRILNGVMWILSQTSQSEDLCLCGAPTPGSFGGDGCTGIQKPWKFLENDSRSQVYDNESYVWWCTYLSKPWHMGISKAQYHQTAAHLIVVCHWIHMTI